MCRAGGADRCGSPTAPATTATGSPRPARWSRAAPSTSSPATTSPNSPCCCCGRPGGATPTAATRSPSWPRCARCSAPAWSAASRSSSTRAASTLRAWPQSSANSPRSAACTPPSPTSRATTCSAGCPNSSPAATTSPTSRPASRWPAPGVEPVTAHAYLGGWGIAQALRSGADVVICGRVTDASLVVGPAAWAFDWAADDWDALAGAVTAGHIIECGTQATGGNYSFFTEIADPVHPGFPIAELHPDGSSVITKHPGTGGAVTVGTVTAQLLYEIGRPAYLNADVVARFDTVRLTPAGPRPGRGRPGDRRARARHAQGVPQPPRRRTGIRRPSCSPASTSTPRPTSPRPPCTTRPAARPASPRTTCGASTANRPTGSPSPSRTPTRTRWGAASSAPSRAPRWPATPASTSSTPRPRRPSTGCTGPRWFPRPRWRK